MIRDDEGPPKLTIHTPGGMEWRNPQLLSDAEKLTKLGLQQDVFGSYGHGSWLVDDK